MREIVIATPLKYSAVSRSHKFKNGISIRDLSGQIDWEQSIVKRTLTEEEYGKVTGAHYWLCAASENEQRDHGPLYAKARRAALALQLILPIAAMHLFLRLEATPRGYDNTGVSNPREMHSTLLGRISDFEQQDPAVSFDALYEGITRTLEEKTIRLENPLLLLEHGMQVGNRPLSTLMFVMGLDMLFMAGNIGPFVTRVGGFIGPKELIFPPDYMQRQPSTTAGEVLRDLYEFRNKIAHGLEIPEKPYREAHNLISTTGLCINTVAYSYADLMMESGLFMLAGSLKRIFTEGLYDTVKDPAAWRRELKKAEQRYANEGGLEPEKQHGW